MPTAQKKKQSIGWYRGEADGVWTESICSIKTEARLFRANKGKVLSEQRTPCTEFKGVPCVAY